MMELPITGFNPDGMARFGNDANLFVFFATKPMHNAQKSREAGIPIYDSVEVVHIQQPGERDYIERPAEDADRHRFQAQYAAYREGREQRPEGTPVELLFSDKPGIAETLKHLKIFTVQQLAHLTEEGIAKIGMGARQYVEQAKQYLGDGKNGKEYHALRAENERLQGQIEVLGQQISELSARLNEAVATQQRSTGQHTSPPIINLPQPGQSVLANTNPEQTLDLSRYVATAAPEALPSTHPQADDETPAAPKRRGRPPKNQPFGA